MIETATRFQLLGGRDYVNAGTLLNGFIDALEREGAQHVKVSRLKAQKTARGNGRLVLARGDAVPGAESAHCIFAAETADGPWRGAFFDEGLSIAGGPAPPYSVAEVEASNFAGRCAIAPQGRAALVFDLIQANKRFHELSAAAGEPHFVRFGYLEDWRVPAADAAFTASVEAVNLIRRRSATAMLTVNRLTYAPGNGNPVSLLLCFEMEALQETPR